MNTKKIYFLVILAGSVSAASLTHAEASYGDAAISSNNTQNPFTGFHATGAVGLGSVGAKIKTAFSSNAGGHITSIDGSQRNTSNGLSFSGLIDYVFPHSDYVVGLEVGGSFFNRETKHESHYNDRFGPYPCKENLKFKYNVQAGALIGKKVNETVLFHFGLGVCHGSFEYVARMRDDKASKKFSLWGVSPFVGLKIKCSEQSLIDIRYQHTFYQEQSVKNLDVDGSVVNGKIKPQASLISIGYSYKF